MSEAEKLVAQTRYIKLLKEIIQAQADLIKKLVKAKCEA